MHLVLKSDFCPKFKKNVISILSLESELLSYV